MPESRSGGAPGASLGGDAPPAAERPATQGGAESGGQIRQVRDQVVDQARSTFKQARERAGASLADSRRQAADQIGGIASAFHRTGDHLRAEDQARIAGLADGVADQAERVADYLRRADARTVARDLEGLARRQPAIVLGAAFAVGLLAARFVKSSEEPASEDEFGGYERIRAGGEPAGLGSGPGRLPAGGLDAPA